MRIRLAISALATVAALVAMLLWAGRPTEIRGHRVIGFGGLNLGRRAVRNVGEISGHGQLRANGIENTGRIELSGGPTLVSSPVRNRSEQFAITGDSVRFEEQVVNEGRIKLTNTTVEFARGLVNHGVLESDPSTSIFSNLTISSTGALAGGVGDVFEILPGGAVANSSTNSAVFNIAQSKLAFDSGSETMTWPALDQGALVAGYSANYTIGILELSSGAHVSIGPGTAGTGSAFSNAVYVGALVLGDGLTQLASCASSVNVYYDATNAANAYLAGGAYNFGSGTGRLLPVGALVTVTSVGVPSAGGYRAGTHLDLTVNFSGAVTVDTSGGVPSLSLTLDSGTVSAAYLSGSGSTALVFRYVVQAGDTANSGIAVGSAITLGGAGLSGGGGVVPTLAGVGSTAAIVVDTAAPIIALGSPSSASLVYGGAVTVAVNYSDLHLASMNLSLADLQLNASGTATGSLGLSGSNGSYTVTITSTGGVGFLSVTVPPGKAADAAGNTAAGATSASITVNQSFGGWAQGQFTANELGQPAISGPTAVYGQDGLSNLVKYALGLTAKVNATTGLPTLTSAGGNWRYQFTTSAAATDVSIGVQYSTDLVHWTSIDPVPANNAAGVSISATPSGPGVNWLAVVPASSAPTVFFRLSVTQ